MLNNWIPASQEPARVSAAGIKYLANVALYSESHEHHTHERVVVGGAMNASSYSDH
jgi:hypothetical protein